MAKTPTTGRISIFRGKVHGVRIQGILTPEGGKALDKFRRRLAKIFYEMTGRTLAVSDADAMEYALRGEAVARAEITRQFLSRT